MEHDNYTLMKKNTTNDNMKMNLILELFDKNFKSDWLKNALEINDRFS